MQLNQSFTYDSRNIPTILALDVDERLEKWKSIQKNEKVSIDLETKSVVYKFQV